MAVLRHTRATLGAIAVATLYVALVIGAPLLVRYAPGMDMSPAVASIAVADAAMSR